MRPRRVCPPLPTARFNGFRTRNRSGGFAALVSSGGRADLAERVHTAAGRTGIDAGGWGLGSKNGMPPKRCLAKRETTADSSGGQRFSAAVLPWQYRRFCEERSEEHTSEL